jgi:hypothetical protein
MTTTITLLEPSIADAITAIEQAVELPEQTRRHWVCSLRQILKWLDRPAAVVAARLSSLRMLMGQLHHARMGVTAKTLQNHKSNVRAALRWFGKEHEVPVRGVPLLAEWATLRDGIEDHGQRARLYGLMRYCSGRGIAPVAVDDTTLNDYLRYRAETTALAFNNTARPRLLGRGMPARTQFKAGPCSGSPSRRSRPRRVRPGKTFPRAYARTLIPTWTGLPSLDAV